MHMICKLVRDPRGRTTLQLHGEGLLSMFRHLTNAFFGCHIMISHQAKALRISDGSP